MIAQGWEASQPECVGDMDTSTEYRIFLRYAFAMLAKLETCYGKRVAAVMNGYQLYD